MNLKKLSILAICIVFILSITACSSSTSGNAGAGKNVTIKYWSMWNKGEPQQKVLQNIIDQYQKENPNVTIQVQWMGRQVLTKVRDAALGGGAPDLTDQDAGEIKGALTVNNLTSSLDGIENMKIPNENTTLKDVIIPGLLDQYKQNGKTVFVPYEVISSGFNYDANLFSKYNITPPKTWDEFITTAKTLKDKGIAPLAEDGNIDFYNAYYYYWITERILGPGALNKAVADKTGNKWDNPGFLEAAQKVQTLVDNGFFLSGYQGSQYPAAQTAWASGKAAMILCGSWIPSETGKYASQNFQYRAFPFPEIDGKQNNYNNEESYLIGWSAPKGANVDAVKKFIAFAMQKKLQQGIPDVAQNLSTRSDITAPDVLKDFKAMLTQNGGFHEVYDGLQADYPQWWKTVFLPLDDKLVFGQIKADEFISKLKQGTIDYWKNNQ